MEYKLKLDFASPLLAETVSYKTTIKLTKTIVNHNYVYMVQSLTHFTVFF